MLQGMRKGYPRVHQITIIAALIAAAFLIRYVFEGHGVAVRAINAGYPVAPFALFGLVIGRWG